MKFLYRKYPAKKREVIEVRIDRPAKVKFMTAAEFKKYAGGRTHTYFGGQEMDGGIRFALPFDGVWHAVVEKGNDPSQGGVIASTLLRMAEPEMEQLSQGMDEGRVDGSGDETGVQDLSQDSQSDE